MKDPWINHDEIFWQSLGDYVIFAVHRVKDLEFDKIRGRMKVKYFAKVKGRIKYPKDIREIFQKIAYLVDTEALPTDFTRFRRMAERRSRLGEMSKEQAALIGAALKFIDNRVKYLYSELKFRGQKVRMPFLKTLVE